MWNRKTAADILRPYCAVEGVEPDSALGRDLSVFRLTARTTRAELIPESCTLVILEPANAEIPFQLVRNTLKYKINIRVRRLLVRLPPDSPPDSPPPTPPSDSSSDEDTPTENPKRRHGGGRRRRAHRSRLLDTPPPPVVGAAVESLDDTSPARLRRASGHQRQCRTHLTEDNTFNGDLTVSATVEPCGSPKDDGVEPETPLPEIPPDLYHPLLAGSCGSWQSMTRTLCWRKHSRQGNPRRALLFGGQATWNTSRLGLKGNLRPNSNWQLKPKLR